MKITKRILAVLACMAMCLSFAACSGGDEVETDYNYTQKTTGAITLDVKKNELIKDSSGKDAVLVTIEITNGTSKGQIFTTSVKSEATQGGEALERALTDYSHQGEDQVETKIAANDKLTVAIAFVLKDTKTAVDLKLTPKSGEDKAAKDFTLNLGA